MREYVSVGNKGFSIMDKARNMQSNQTGLRRDTARLKKVEFLSSTCIATSAALLMVVAAPSEGWAVTPASYIPCSSAPTPPPTTSTDLFTALLGQDGKGGAGSSPEGPGHAGDPGGPGGSATFTTTTTLSSISFFSLGGNGGEGSNAGSANPAGPYGGGVGVQGGDGGTLNLTIANPVAQGDEASLFSAVCAFSGGGTGGKAGLSQDHGPKHPSGLGGAGGSITVTNNSTISSQQGAGVMAWATAGDGANGKTENGSINSGNGGDAGAGGSGQVVTVTNSGTITSYTTGLLAKNIGGDGGKGGDAYTNGTLFHGGAGGDGGAGGIVTVNNSGSITTLSDGSIGIWAQAFGGIGGAGGGVGAGGKGGVGGVGGGIAITLGGTIATAGQDAPGVLAQSFGGQGALGGSGIAGGAGGTGGDGGSISIQGGGTIHTGSSNSPQTNSQGILAQAIGGGGGNGGNANAPAAWSEIGGSGGVTANGGNVTINTGTSITTYGERSQGIIAQSVGGGGGNGGNANGTGTFYNLAIGGSGTGGGDGQSVLAHSTGTLATNGLHATGMLLQSIGGGGGSGGAAISTVDTDLIGIAVATGGAGSTGGTGGAIGQVTSGNTVLPTNGGVILTSGAESTGILGQSIGGGGGKGGPSGTGGGEIQASDSLQIWYGHGGRGGAGGWGGTVSLENGGMILTSGAGSRGLYGQSIGAGGGDGGDASIVTASGYNGYSTWPLAITHSVGGSGGVVGSANTITLLNSALIVTTGADADAMLGQSIGGGGGTTGSGDGYSLADITVDTTAGATAGKDPNGTEATGGHGDGGVVTLTNSNNMTGGGSIVTLGDGAAGMLAQSIGGGGGRIGGMAGQAENFSVTTKLGMSSGSGSSRATDGSNGPVVNVANYGPILTFGADAAGIVAQSIGGGGGLAGKGATSLGYAKSTGDGGNGVDTAWTTLSKIASAGIGTLGDYTSVQDVIGLGNSLLGNQTDASLEYVQQLADMGASQGTAASPQAAGSINVNLTLGASSNGTGLNGGSIQVTNAGYLTTIGKMSSGVVAQSIGGGGGIAGAANMAYSSGSSAASLTLGGTGGSSGDGGAVSAVNTAGGTIMTISSLAPGIVAQSIGGGGGMASLSGNTTALLPALEIGLGNLGASGGGGEVTVTNRGWIATLSHDSPAIIAQSIGGGGGLVRVLATDQETGSGQIIDGGSAQYNLTMGGSCDPNCPAREAGNVSVTTSDQINTSGNGSHGILAQSIGGGGGAVLGGVPSGTTFFANNFVAGSGGKVEVVAGNADGSRGGSIYTTGEGAVAILAQSIGGGGGLAGNLGMTSQRWAFAPQTDRGGPGDTVTITVYGGANLQTSGANAPVILAQSIGGGGGIIANSASGANSGSLGGIGGGNLVTVDVHGQVIATGRGSLGIFAESNGYQGFTFPITVTVNAGGKVQGGLDTKVGDSSGAGVYLVGGGTDDPADGDSPNVVTVQSGGTLTSLAGTSGTAVYSSAGYTEVLNNGTISGSILLTNNGGAGCFTNNGTYNAGNRVVVSPSCDITNAGTMNIGSASAIERTTVRGNFVQAADGVLNIDADFKNGQSDKLDIDGRASIAGSLHVQPVNLSNRSVTVLTAAGGVAVDSQLAQTDNMFLFNFPVSVLGNDLRIKPEATFSGTAAGFGQNRQALAGHLQRLWDSGADFEGYTALASIADNGSYRQALETANGETLGAIAALRFAASRNFVTDVYGCPKDGAASVISAEGSCIWGRAFGNSARQGTTANALGYDMTSTMLQVGGQWQFAPNWFAGASLAYETSRLEGSHGIATIDGDNVLAGAALTYQSGGWLLSGAVDGGYGWYDSRRNIVVGSFSDVAEASPTAWHIGFHGRAAYEMALGDWYVTPSASVHAVYAHGNGFTETGASPFNLAVEDQDGFALTAAAAVEVGKRIDLGAYGVLRPFLGAGVSFTTADDWMTKARFTSLPGVADSFSTASPVPEVLGKLTAGVELAGSSSWDIRLQYDAEMGQDYLSHTGVARLSVHF
jgi:uncharacterized protein YhjY with autotransporter beta-barrel domain